MSTSDAILSRLDKVRQTGPGRWLASCPAHEDRSPSLSVRELDDGRVLFHDFGGCGTDDVLAALGLDMSDLYPAPLPSVRSGGGYAPSHSRIPAADLLEAVDHELTVVVVVLADILRTRAVTSNQLDRLTQAAARIGRARDLARPATIRHREPTHG